MAPSPHLRPRQPASGPWAPPPLGRRLGRAGGTVLAFALLVALLYLKALPCAFAWVFHQPCPGCGSTRSVIALLHGDVEGALLFNPFGALMALLIGVLALDATRSVLRHGDLRGAAEGPLGRVLRYAIVIVASLEVLLWAARWFGAFGGPVPV